MDKEGGERLGKMVISFETNLKKRKKWQSMWIDGHEMGFCKEGNEEWFEKKILLLVFL